VRCCVLLVTGECSQLTLSSTYTKSPTLQQQQQQQRWHCQHDKVNTASNMATALHWYQTICMWEQHSQQYPISQSHQTGGTSCCPWHQGTCNPHNSMMVCMLPCTFTGHGACVSRPPPLPLFFNPKRLEQQRRSVCTQITGHSASTAQPCRTTAAAALHLKIA
jgi:hypothetical protein